MFIYLTDKFFFSLFSHVQFMTLRKEKFLEAKQSILYFGQLLFYSLNHIEDILLLVIKFIIPFHFKLTAYTSTMNLSRLCNFWWIGTSGPQAHSPED